MPKYEIKITTPADTSGADKTAASLKKVAASAEDVKKKIDAMFEAEQKALKQERVFGDEAQQNAAHLSKLTQEAKAHGAQVDKVVGIKARWIDAFKKLQTQVPGLAYVLGALKNPLVALAAVIAVAINWLTEFNAKIKELRSIVGEGALPDQFRNLGTVLKESEVFAKQFSQSLQDIAARSDTVDEKVAKLAANLNRTLEIEARLDERAKQAELAGAATPEQRAAIESKFAARAGQREQRRLGGAADFAAQGQFRAQDIVREGLAQLPEEQRRLEDAKLRRQSLLDLAERNTTDPDKLAAIEAQIAEIEDPGFFGSVKRQARFGTREAMLATYESLKATRENLLAGNQAAQGLRVQADADFQSAQSRFDAFTGRITAAQEDVRKFSGQRGTALETAQAFLPLNIGGPAEPFGARGGTGPGSLQFRFDAIQQHNEAMAALRKQYAEAIALQKDLIALISGIRGEVRRQASTE